MVLKGIKFDGIEINEYKFHQHKSLISINDIDINEVVVSHRLPFGKQESKYIIVYKYNKKLGLYAYSFQK